MRSKPVVIDDHHRRWAALGLVAALAAALPAPAVAQGVDPLARALATARWVGEYVRVPSAVLGPDGPLIVETSEKQLILIDAAGRERVSPLRDGEGPEEVRAIRRVAPYRGDSVVVFGRAMTRAVVVTSDGVPVRTKVLAGFNTDSTWLFQYVGTGPGGELAYISPRRAVGRRDSADVLLLSPAMETERSVAALWYPPPKGLYSDEDTPAADHDHDQVLLLPSGYLVFYHSALVGLEVRRLGRPVARRYQLPAVDRPVSRAERRGLTAAAEQVAARRDSALASIPPETRKLIMARLTAAGVGTIPDRVSAYESDGLVALTETVVAMERKQLIAMPSTTYDWLDVTDGTSGSFTLPRRVAIIGGGRDSVVVTRRDDDDLVSIAVLPIQAFRTPRLPIVEPQL